MSDAAIMLLLHLPAASTPEAGPSAAAGDDEELEDIEVPVQLLSMR